nr:immunoglobulin heavy chain junction region [Macaca mulatta]MOW86583.1 immunoglobulin heavy chain junction region [Macaca mulatta]MOW86600.1 immunoglobulin heavy chain junction region [Macaca mulatta]MOW86637.1 immunoglobulin heavy chain junction region [Macaca mulatta]MOW86684.1 immunoglobulin heavy chain junction region [Macaca mulatta]
CARVAAPHWGDYYDGFHYW